MDPLHRRNKRTGVSERRRKADPVSKRVREARGDQPISPGLSTTPELMIHDDSDTLPAPEIMEGVSIVTPVRSSAAPAAMDSVLVVRRLNAF